MSDLIPRPSFVVSNSTMPGEPGPPTHAWEAPETPSFGIDEIISIIRRRLWLVLLFAVIGVTAAYLIVRRIPPLYGAKAVVRIEDPSATMAPSIVGSMTGAVGGGIATQIQIFKTRAVLGPVVDKEGLRIHPVSDSEDLDILVVRETAADLPDGNFVLHFTPSSYTITGSYGSGSYAYDQTYDIGGLRLAVAKQAHSDSAAFRVRDREQTIERLAPNLTLTPRIGTPVIDVTFQASNPALARRVVNVAVEVFRDYNAQTAKQQSIRRRTFVEEQLASTEIMLHAAQEAMADFRRKEKVLSLDTRFSAEQSSLTALELRRQENIATRQVYAKLLNDLANAKSSDKISEKLEVMISSPDFSGNSVISSLYSSLVKAESERDAVRMGPYGAAESSAKVQQLNEQIASLTQRIANAVRSQVQWMDVRLEAGDALVGLTKSAIERLPDVLSQEERLQYELNSISSLADQLRAEYQKAKLTEAIEVGNVEIIDQATLPRTPLPSGNGLKIGLGLGLGLLLGILSAVILENLDNTVRHRDELSGTLMLTDLGFIPRIAPTGEAAATSPNWLRALKRQAVPPSRNKGKSVAVASVPRFIVPEAFSTIRTNLLFSQHLKQIKSLVVTSAAPGEGKTTTAVNLALAYAKHGFNVLLMDCDLRRASLHRTFEVSRSPGISEVAAGLHSLASAIQTTSVPGLSILPAGTQAPNSTEILGSSQMSDILNEVVTQFDITIIDTAPLVVGSDAAILSVAADGVLLVVRAGRTERALVQAGTRQLRTVGARIVGAVLNDSDGKVMKYEGSKYGYYYAYGYGYGETDDVADDET
jgi:capsular exopolysaccharide synthesis family protein